MSGIQHGRKPDTFTLRLIVDLAASRANALSQSVSAQEAHREFGSRALAELAMDLEALATEFELSEKDALSHAARRFTVERAVRQHLEAAISAAMGPNRLQDFLTRRAASKPAVDE